MPPMKRVRVTMGGKVVSEVDVDRVLTIGRKPPADIVVADADVSKMHARIRPDGDRLYVSDLGSTNGTSVDGGERLAPNREVPLEPGQKLVLASAVIEVIEAERPQSSAGFAATERTVAVGGGLMQSALVNVARFKAAQARLVVAAEHDRRVLPIAEMEVVVGRDGEEAQIVIQHQSVSGRHARIRFEDGRFVVEDLKSANGTFLDGSPVAAATPVGNQQALTFGTVDCLFVQRPPETAAGAGEDARTEALCAHVVRLAKATRQQADDVLAEHRRSGTQIGQLFVERGILGAKEWSEIHRQRDVIASMSPVAAGSRASPAKVVGILVVILGLAAVAAVFLFRK
jgi:pSer/pThr/pTyr-binding forkhead associated (FHA) protein